MEGESELQIAYDCLAKLLESRLNKAGKLLVFIHSAGGHLVEVHPAFRLPNTLRRFAYILNEMLRRGEILGHGTGAPLLKLVSGPVLSVLPRDCRCVGLTAQ